LLLCHYTASGRIDFFGFSSLSLLFLILAVALCDT
jgi:hypothetical protein